jgi:UDP-N-acetylmuramoyl-tripeptide--D-alanyl-D-alanine ligase
LKGEKFNGSDFALDAKKQGAISFILDKNPENIPNSLVVNNPYDSLVQLAKYKRNTNKSCVFFGVTGSVGKTTVKELLTLVFSSLTTSYSNPGNYNNHIGLPLSLANLDESKVAIFELGMNHPGEISCLTSILLPQIVIITGIAPAHLEFFQSLDEIALAKAEIIEKSPDFVIINSDSPCLDILLKAAENKKVILYGSKEVEFDAYLRLSLFKVEKNDLGMRITCNYSGALSGTLTYQIGLYSKVVASNSLAAAAALFAFILKKKLQINLVQQGLEKLQDFAGLPGRGLTKKLGNITLLDESYNANPTSMAAALTRLADFENGRKIAIIGDMLELGEREIAFHEELLPLVANLDLVLLVGSRMKALKNLLKPRKALWFKEVDSLLKKLPKIVKSRDVILVKGSNSIKLSKVVQYLEENFQDN